MQDMRERIGVFLLVLFLAGCGSHRVPIQQNTNISDTETSNRQKILFLSGIVSYDSLSAIYKINIYKQQQFEGKLNLEGISQVGEMQGLHYLQVDADSTVLSQHQMPNPLIRSMEYFDGDMPVTKNVTMKEAELFMRVQLNPKTRRIVFRNGTQHIMTLEIDTQ